MSAQWTGQVASPPATIPTITSLPSRTNLVQERAAEQFTPVVEFEVLAGAGEVNRLAGTRQRLCARCHLDSRSVGDRDDPLSELNWIG